jgi:hypothetical protein
MTAIVPTTTGRRHGFADQPRSRIELDQVMPLYTCPAAPRQAAQQVQRTLR